MYSCVRSIRREIANSLRQHGFKKGAFWMDYFEHRTEIYRRVEGKGFANTRQNLWEEYNLYRIERRSRKEQISLDDAKTKMTELGELVTLEKFEKIEDAILKFYGTRYFDDLIPPNKNEARDPEMIDNILYRRADPIADTGPSIEELAADTTRDTKIRGFLMDFRQTIKTERDREIFDHQLMPDLVEGGAMSLEDLGQKWGVTKQAISLRKKKLERELRDYLEDKVDPDLLGNN